MTEKERELLEEALHYLTGLVAGTYCNCEREQHFNDGENRAGLIDAFSRLGKMESHYQNLRVLAVEAIALDDNDELAKVWDWLTDLRYK